MNLDAITPLASDFPDAIVVLTLDGRVAHWSSGARLSFGFSADEAIGRVFEDLVVPVDRAAEQHRMLTDTLAAGTIAYESVRRRKDGSLLYVDVTTKLLDSRDGGAP